MAETPQTNQSKNNYVLSLLGNINNYNHYFGLYAINMKNAGAVFAAIDTSPEMDKSKVTEAVNAIQQQCLQIANEMMYNALQCKLLLKPMMDKETTFVNSIDDKYKAAFEADALPKVVDCEAYGVLINKFCTEKLAKDILDNSENDIKNFINQ